MEEIILPHAKNATIPIQDLITYFRENNLKYMIIGATHVALQNHPNPSSLDVWFRNHENVYDKRNTCQAVKDVIKQIIRHEQFSQAVRINQKTGIMCKSLVFCDCHK